MLDLKIVGGLLADGRGGAPYRGHLGVRDGRIVAVGPEPIAEDAAEVVDADGLLVTPGFVDLHTHYDGQATWDSEMAPSSQHGVTTAIMGSCGVGFAPVRPGQEHRLLDLMEGVEDIPGAALAEGIDWRWESFGEYMDALATRPRTMDLGAMVPHDVLRIYALGDRAAASAVATPDEIAQMRALLGAALDAGAIGFSTGRTDNHRTTEGKATPASEAHRDELIGLAQAFAGRSRGVLQAVSDFDLSLSEDRFAPEFQLLVDMARAAGGRPLSMSVMQRVNAPDQWVRILSGITEAQQAGVPLFAQVAPRPIGVLLGLEATFHPFMGHPSYKAVSHLPLAERVAHLRRPEVRARMLQETPEPVAGDGSPLPPLADALLARIGEAAMLMFRLSDPPCYEPDPTESLGVQAIQTGQSALGVLYDALLEEDGNALIYFAIFNYLGLSLDNVHKMLTHPHAMIGLSDGGAHVGTICDASFPTTLLSWWGRDRPHNRLPLGRVVHMLSGQTAGSLGLDDRGILAPGRRADLNLIDHSRLHLLQPGLVADLPAGGKRFLQRAVGYRATYVQGVCTLRDDRLTGSTPGGVVRLGR